jgi:tRNA G37 N-methylase Trm5
VLTSSRIVDECKPLLLGLLPDSECSWAAAVAALKAESGGVLHVHGNVASGEEAGAYTLSHFS